MTLVIPGVEVSVVKELVVPQLAPSGVLGLVGDVEKAPTFLSPVQSAGSFIDQYGAATSYSLPEAAQALGSGVAELIISPLPADDERKAYCEVLDDALKACLVLTARVAGPWANGLRVSVKKRNTQAQQQVMDVQVIRGETVLETVRNVPCPTADEIRGARTAAQTAEATDKKAQDALTRAKAAKGADAADALSALSRMATEADHALTAASDARDAMQISGIARRLGAASALLRVEVAPDRLDTEDNASPAAGEYTLGGGTQASPQDYEAAIAALADEPDVDLVMASLPDMSSPAATVAVYGAVIAHCEAMSRKAQGRIGFGHVPPTAAPGKVMSEDIHAWTTLVNDLRSDRFVLLAPGGVAGAIAGMVGSLDYYQSPTFKTPGALRSLDQALTVEQQQQLLQAFIVPVTAMRGRGTVVLRGLTTDGDQIIVRRVEDLAVRGVQLIGNLFIGRLNNDVGRGALKQKLTEFLVQMERDSAIVPSTDGKLPSFTLDVYSSQSDFSQGVVRISLAVRPVRAIDYIYATVLVQA